MELIASTMASGGLVGGGGATGLGEDGRWGVCEGRAKRSATYVDAKY